MVYMVDLLFREQPSAYLRDGAVNVDAVKMTPHITSHPAAVHGGRDGPAGPALSPAVRRIAFSDWPACFSAERPSPADASACLHAPVSTKEKGHPDGWPCTHSCRHIICTLLPLLQWDGNEKAPVETTGRRGTSAIARS